MVRITVQLNDALAKSVRAHAQKLGVTQSAAMRDLLRAGLGVAVQKRAWLEAMHAAMRRIKQRLQDVIDEDMDL